MAKPYNLEESSLIVLRNPVAGANEEFGFRYASVTTYSAGDTVTPLARPQARINVADLLP